MPARGEGCNLTVAIRLKFLCMGSSILKNNLSWHHLTAISHKGQRVVKQCFILRIVISALYLLQ